MNISKDEVLIILRVISGGLLITGFVRLRISVERTETTTAVAIFSHTQWRDWWCIDSILTSTL